MQAALPGLERVVAYCRTPERLREFCTKVDAEPAESHAEAAEQEVVVTITTSRDPVVRGDWLRPGALVCAAGANDPSKRELDNVVLERAAFVCCDSTEDAMLESGDLIEAVESGVLDWLEVHELHEVVAGEVAGRAADDDIVVFKSNGLAIWDVAIAAELLRRARERGVGRTRLDAETERFARVGDRVLADRLDDLGPVEQARALVRVEAVLDVAVLEDLGEVAAAVVLPDHVRGDPFLGRRTLEEEREEVAERHRGRLYPPL